MLLKKIAYRGSFDIGKTDFDEHEIVTETQLPIKHLP